MIYMDTIHYNILFIKTLQCLEQQSPFVNCQNAFYFYHPQTKFAKVMFLHLSVSHSVHGGVSRPTPRGGVEGSGQGVSRCTPGGCLQAHTGGVSQHALRQTPPGSRQLLLRAVRILLECILVISSNGYPCDWIQMQVYWLIVVESDRELGTTISDEMWSSHFTG